MPSRQAPAPSCQAIQAPPLWPLTLHTDPQIPAVCRWLSCGHRMLMMVNHLHLHFCFYPPFLSQYIIQRKSGIIFSWHFSQSCPDQCPGGLFLIAYSAGILFHFCLTAGSSAAGSLLNVPWFLCPQPVLYFRLSSVSVIGLPLSCSFLSLLSSTHFVSVGVSVVLLPYFSYTILPEHTFRHTEDCLLGLLVSLTCLWLSSRLVH